LGLFLGLSVPDVSDDDLSAIMPVFIIGEAGTVFVTVLTGVEQA
jgi:hypothetical protein